MAKTIREPYTEEFTTYRREFDYEGHRGWGCTFECDEHGNVDEAKLKREKPAAYANYRACLTGTLNGSPVVDRGVVKLEHAIRHPRIIECVDCGREVELYNAFTITCECGADYNSAGQRLAPREQWGEETGEAWYECY
jgi:hypothetical protein